MLGQEGVKLAGIPVGVRNALAGGVEDHRGQPAPDALPHRRRNLLGVGPEFTVLGVREDQRIGLLHQGVADVAGDHPRVGQQREGGGGAAGDSHAHKVGLDGLEGGQGTGEASRRASSNANRAVQHGAARVGLPVRARRGLSPG